MYEGCINLCGVLGGMDKPCLSVPIRVNSCSFVAIVTDTYLQNLCNL